MRALDESEIKAKYPGIIGNRFISAKRAIEELSSTENSRFSININMNHYPTKNRKHADSSFHIARDGEEPIAIIKEIKEPELVFRYSTKASIETIVNMLKRKKISPLYHGNYVDFNKYHFNNLVKYYGLKDNDKFCWKYTVGNTNFFRYSLQALEFLVAEIQKDPEHILDNIKK